MGPPDVSGVGPLNAYAARSCPVRSQWDELRPAEPVGPSTFVQALGDQGATFEEQVVERLLDLHGAGAVRIGGNDAADRISATVTAMEDGVPIVVGGLPIDEAGRRVGEPDVLVRGGTEPVDGRWRYRPVEIKGHSMLVDDRGAPVVTSQLDGLADAQFEPASRSEVGNRDSGARPDLLQVAHYHRTLGTCGHAVPRQVWGGVIGSEAEAVWYRLDDRCGRPPPSPTVASARPARPWRSATSSSRFAWTFVPWLASTPTTRQRRCWSSPSGSANATTASDAVTVFHF